MCVVMQSLLDNKGRRLLQVFIGGACVGGADEVEALIASGDFAQLLEGFQANPLPVELLEVRGRLLFVRTVVF